MSRARDPKEFLEVLGNELRPAIGDDPGPRFRVKLLCALQDNLDVRLGQPKALREDPFVPEDFKPETATIQVSVQRPGVVHSFPAERVFSVVRSLAQAPAQMERNRLRAILKPGAE